MHAITETKLTKQFQIMDFNSLQTKFKRKGGCMLLSS